MATDTAEVVEESTEEAEAAVEEESSADVETAEQAATEETATEAGEAEVEAGGEADWGDAMAEQQQAAVQATNAEAQVFNELSGQNIQTDSENDIDFILDIPVQLTVELGRTKIAIKNLLQLAQGSVVELDGLAGEPMDVLVNGCLIAQGEVVVVNDKFGIRLTDVITPAERIRKINK